MKKLLLSTVVALFACACFAQQLPSVNIKNLNGKQINTSELTNDGKPMIINFWATWCKPCLKEMSAINDAYLDWVDETGVKMYAVSIDDSRSSARVKTLANAQSWEFEVLLDENGDFKRAMNVANPPHVFVIDGKGNVVFQHNGYSDGSEQELIDVVRRLNAGEEVKQK
ncbi:MAG: TlpA family protein disulfide reductase [Bacteroides sp.]|nr:TlpA family protein disulfide reductase [Ruminococcus flavefaciens]MCM1555160.1 TlpA family protein disulfide reductase [Bacteroides sp.]